MTQRQVSVLEMSARGYQFTFVQVSKVVYRSSPLKSKLLNVLSPITTFFKVQLSPANEHRHVSANWRNWNTGLFFFFFKLANTSY